VNWIELNMLRCRCCVWRTTVDKDEYYCLPYQSALTAGGTLYGGDYYHDLETAINNVDCLPTSACSAFNLRRISPDTLNGLSALPIVSDL